MYETLKHELKRRSISVNQLSFMSRIASSDLYTALSGKKPLFPVWRKRIAEALEIPVEDLFPNGNEQITETKE